MGTFLYTAGVLHSYTTPQSTALDGTFANRNSHRMIHQQTWASNMLDRKEENEDITHKEEHQQQLYNN